MIRRFLLYGMISVIIVGFGLLLGAGWNPRSGAGSAMQNHLDTLKNSIDREQWITAEASLAELEDVWSAIYLRLDFTQERLPLFQFETDLAKIRGAILAHDREGGMQLVMELKSIWAAF